MARRSASRPQCSFAAQRLRERLRTAIDVHCKRRNGASTVPNTRRVGGASNAAWQTPQGCRAARHGSAYHGSVARCEGGDSAHRRRRRAEIAAHPSILQPLRAEHAIINAWDLHKTSRARSVGASVRPTDQTLSCTARALVPKPVRHAARRI